MPRYAQSHRTPACSPGVPDDEEEYFWDDVFQAVLGDDDGANSGSGSGVQDATPRDVWHAEQASVLPSHGMHTSGSMLSMSTGDDTAIMPPSPIMHNKRPSVPRRGSGGSAGSRGIKKQRASPDAYTYTGEGTTLAPPHFPAGLVSPMTHALGNMHVATPMPGGVCTCDWIVVCDVFARTRVTCACAGVCTAAPPRQVSAAISLPKQGAASLVSPAAFSHTNDVALMFPHYFRTEGSTEGSGFEDAAVALPVPQHRPLPAPSPPKAQPAQLPLFSFDEPDIFSPAMFDDTVEMQRQQQIDAANAPFDTHIKYDAGMHTDDGVNPLFLDMFDARQ